MSYENCLKKDHYELESGVKKDFEKIKYCIISNSRTQNCLKNLFLFSLDNKFS